MSEQQQPGARPEPKVDGSIVQAPGGADAAPATAGDIGAGEDPDRLAIPDPPFSAQHEKEEIPAEIQEGEDSDQADGTDPQGGPEADPEAGPGGSVSEQPG